MEKVSVVVPVYGCAPYLSKCLDSLLNQSYGNLEILLIDDGSPDNSHAICEAYSRRDSRIRYYRKKNGGLSDARNHALDRAQGAWVAFVDSDDYVEREYIEKMLGAAKRHGTKIACCGYYRAFPDKAFPVCYAHSGEISGQALWTSIMEGEDIGNFMCNKLFDIRLFDGLRFPVGKKYEDIWMFHRLAAGERRFAVVSEPLYYYVARQGSITGSFTTVSSEHFMAASEQLAAYIIKTYPELGGRCAAYCVRAHIDNMNGLMKSGVPMHDPHFKHSREYLKAHWGEQTGLSRKYNLIAAVLRYAPWTLYGVQRARRLLKRT